MPAESAVSLLSFAVRARSSVVPFFRGRESLRALRRAARVRLKTLRAGEPLRVWVPQCAGGEDAYSAAICLLEEFGPRWRETPLHVFATDADEDALSRARAGRYPAAAGRAVARERRGKFFVQEHGRLRVRPFLRDACRFVGHRPGQNPPFSRLDLIASRGTLAALPPGTREHALSAFFSALAPGGVLLDETGAASDSPLLFSAPRRGRSYVVRAAASRGTRRGGPAPDEMLRDSETKLRLLLAKTDEAILVQDAETGLILEANTAAERLFGRAAAELLGVRARDLIAAPESVRRAVNERRSEARLRLPHFRRKDGTLFAADTSRTFLMLKGRPCHLWLVRDATPRLILQSGRRSAAACAVFMGEVVHELRSPISVIRGSAETLLKGVRGGRARSTFLRFIENHAGRMAALVDQLLDLSSAEHGRAAAAKTRVPLTDALWETVAAFAPVAKRRGITVALDVAGDLPVLAEPGDVPHIFGNLIDNALKFAPRGGAVRIRGRVEDGMGVVTVRDDGAGIAPQDLARVFERFFRAESARRTKGTGLGLAIVQRIVEANGGRVVAENDPAGGALFRVSLPLAPEELS